MKGTLNFTNGRWKIDGSDLNLHPSDTHYKGEPLKTGLDVDFDIQYVDIREMRDFTGSFSIKKQKVAKLKE